MRKFLASVALALGLLGIGSSAHAAPVEYVKVCTVYGAGFHYIAGNDICFNDATGDARQQTEGGLWRSILPYPEGKWIANSAQECAPGRLVRVGSFKSTDFTLNAYGKKQTSPVPLKVSKKQFISKVMMSGGFYDPRLPARHGTNGADGLCVRSTDPNVMIYNPGGDYNPTYGNNGQPIGCIANSRIVNMPSTYSISATASYPEIGYDLIDQKVYGPYIYGSQLVVTTDLFPNNLTYLDANQIPQPMAGTLNVSVCVQPASNSVEDAGPQN